MSKIAVNEITDEVGTGAPAFPNGMSATGAALTDPQITGGIFLGGTGTANKLDDYEEGTWTPVYLPESGSLSVVYAQNNAAYTKIGNVVHVSGSIRTSFLSLNTASGDLFIGNLPFTSFNDSTIRPVVSITAANGFGGENPLSGYVEENTTRIRLWYRSSVTGDELKSNVTDLEESSLARNFLFFSATYTV